MLSKQIQFYNKLDDNQQYIIRLAALFRKEFSNYNIEAVVPPNKKISNKLIKEVLILCESEKIVTKESYSKNYSFDLRFMVWLFPLTLDLKNEQQQIKKNSYSHYIIDPATALRDYLYALFLEKDSLRTQEAKVIFNIDALSQALVVIFAQPLYEPVFESIDAKIKEPIISCFFSNCIQNLEPLNQFNEERFKKHFDASATISIFCGDFQQGLKLFSPATAEFYSHFIEALHQLLIENNKELAMSFFEKGMKKQRGFLKNTYLPIRGENALYYLIMLLLQPSEIYAPIIQKAIASLEKNRYSSADAYFIIMCQYVNNNKPFVSQKIAQLQQIIQNPIFTIHNIWAIITLFFIDEKLNETAKEEACNAVEKAYKNGYIIFALEAAFALKNWWQEDAEISRLYKEIRNAANYQPALSLIERQEDWLKGLNALLGIGGKKTTKASGEKEINKHRVVYYITPKSLSIQPVLQTRQSNGWTAGRNIALKTFHEGKAKGMTEQDYKVSKCMHYSNNYYDSYYEFKETVFKELIGHPYVFLSGSNDIPVELVEGKPIVNVVKNNKGYRLSCDLENFDTKFFVQKETNTRYLVYNLSEQQLQILKTLKLQNITVPEKGKSLLMKVLSNFSTQLTVHSDLLNTEASDIKQIAPDSKIRVQLLPFGNGLKAELFAKPFGDFPPYCKPGVGGKVLISTQKGTQLQVARDLKKEKELADLLYNDIQLLENIDITDNLIAFDEPLDSLYLLDILEKHKDIAVVEWPEGEKYKIKKYVDFGNLNLKISGKTNWFELQGELQVDEKTVLTIQQVLELTKKGHGNFVELSNGEFLAFSENLRKQLNELNSFVRMDKNGIQLNKFSAVSMGDFFDEFDHLKVDKAWKDFQKQIREAGKQEASIPENLQAELRPYQEEGFRWMTRLSEWGAGACLADDMGLGKTIQALSILLHRAHLGAAMVICPVSVLPNWVNETRKFAPSLNIKTLLSGNRKEIIESLEAGDLLVISYGLLQSEEKLLSEITWATLVLDEAHTIKNYATKTSKAAMSLQASFKLALTGTPIQNHLGEMWNLFNFINPGLLGSLQHFTDHFIKPEGESARKHLKKLITPFILRRTKTAVLDELPPKTEIIKRIQLSNEEMAFYEALRREAILSLETNDEPGGAKHLKALAEIMRLRQACCNPALVNRDLKIPSTKLSTFLDIANELKENKHRAIVFSQFVTHLSLVKKALDNEKISYQYLDGSTPIGEREKAVKRFQSGEGDLFLISLKAGGLGLNLTAADFVIHLDPWWNPAVEDQASDRAHRIGQSRPVTVYRLVAENTIEEKIIELHNTKRNLADSLLEGSDQSAKLSIKELMSLIKGE